MLTPTLSDTDSDAQADAGRKDSAGVEPATKFAPIPQPQNIVRCPPVNWAKYHLVGESLDKMHNEQKRYPGANEPPRTHQGTKAPPHAVAAPYSPFLDGMSDPSKSHQRGAKKGFFMKYYIAGSGSQHTITHSKIYDRHVVTHDCDRRLTNKRTYPGNV